MTNGNGKPKPKPKGKPGRKGNTNWDKERLEYLGDPERYPTLKRFAELRKHNISTLERIAGRDKWNIKRRQMLASTEDKLAMLQAEKIFQARQRHESIGKELQDIGMRSLRARKAPLLAPDALRAATSGVTIERGALGMDMPAQLGGLQINQYQAVVNMINNAGNGEEAKLARRLLTDFGAGPKKASG